MKRIVLTILASLVCILLQAQTAVTVSGGNASGGGGTVSYSVGQVVYPNPALFKVFI